MATIVVDVAVRGARIGERVRRATILVAVAGLSVAVLTIVVDPRLGLLAVAVVFGWTRLVGL
jgi:hypothetical protein